MGEIILGSAQLGLDYGINNSEGALTSEKVISILKSAYSLGVRKIDTAIAYGEAHDKIGKYHDTNPNSKFDLITKLGSSDIDTLEHTIERELSKTKVDSFYGVLLHKASDVINQPEVLSRLVEVKQTGKIQKIGVSIYGNDEFEKILAYPEIEIIQFPFNVLDNYSQRGKWIDIAKNRDVELHIRSVFLQGLFFKDPTTFSGNLLQLKSVILDVHELSKKSSVPVEELLIGYVKMIDQLDGIIIGTETKEQLMRNVHAFNQVILNHSIRDQIESLTITDVSMLNPSNWKP